MFPISKKRQRKTDDLEYALKKNRKKLCINLSETVFQCS
jgi:hypothetical protein